MPTARANPASCNAWATSPANLPSTEKNENAPDRHQLSFVTYDLEKWLRTLDIPAGTTQVVTYTVNSSKSKLHLDFAGYYPGSTIPAPGRPIWAIGGCDGYIGYPQEPGSMERSFTVQVTRKELGAPGAVDGDGDQQDPLPVGSLDETSGLTTELAKTTAVRLLGGLGRLDDRYRFIGRIVIGQRSAVEILVADAVVADVVALHVRVAQCVSTSAT